MEQLIKILEPFSGKLFSCLTGSKKECQIYLVGGAIRDALLKRDTFDLDFVVVKNGIEFAKKFAQKVEGRFVLLDEKEDEARVVYKKKYTFDFNGAESIENDLSRRDFTMNAIAMDIKNFHIIDPYNGKKDIKNRTIKMIDRKNLLDDPLRILRAFRFHATLGFKIEKKTQRVLTKHKNLLKNVAKERIRNELFLILGSQYSYDTLLLMSSYGILDIIIKGVSKMREIDLPKATSAQGKIGGNLLDHSLLTVKEIEKKPLKGGIIESYIKHKSSILKLSALLHDIGKPSCFMKTDNGKVHFYGHETRGVEMLKHIKEDLKLSKKEYQIIETLIKYHMRPHLLASSKDYSEKAIWRLVRDAGDEIPGLLLLSYADALASSRENLSDLPKRISALNEVIKKSISIYSDIQIPKFKRFLSGYDLIDMGLTPGPIFKEILKEVEELQVEGKIKTKQEAINFVKRTYL